jgi:uncharacterized protein YecE (DUF72 family)
MPTPAVLKSWASQVPEEFQFALKAPQRITHFQRLKGAQQSVKEFLAAAKVLKKHLGPLLFQLPGNFKKDLPRLAAFLKRLPAKQPVAFEFRHPSWLEEDTFELLRKRKVALCTAEAEDGIDTPLIATTDWGYLRLRMANYSDRDLKSWIKRITAQKWTDVFIFFKHEDEGNGPRFAERFLKFAK